MDTDLQLGDEVRFEHRRLRLRGTVIELRDGKALLLLANKTRLWVSVTHLLPLVSRELAEQLG